MFRIKDAVPSLVCVPTEGVFISDDAPVETETGTGTCIVDCCCIGVDVAEVGDDDQDDND